MIKLASFILADSLSKISDHKNKDIGTNYVNHVLSETKVQNQYNKSPIQIKNTLEARLEQLSTQNLPKIRNDLFGANPNRKFTD